MSDVWKRLANVARGTVKTWSQELTSPGSGGDDEVDDDLSRTPVSSGAPPRTEEPDAAPSSAQLQRRRDILALALADGTITRAEYDQRLADLEAGVGTPDKPKKRTL